MEVGRTLVLSPSTYNVVELHYTVGSVRPQRSSVLSHSACVPLIISADVMGKLLLC
jgi:hypothetical protein